MRNGSHRSRAQAASAGFTYIGVLITLAIIAVASAATLQLGVIMQRRVAEAELLDIGAAFQEALSQYARATPLGQATSPRSLQDLLKDPRYPGTRRYLRQVYVDPLTGKEEWGLILSPQDKGIIGIFSQSAEKPLKIGNFPDAFIDFENKTSYQEWRFIAPSQIAPTILPAKH